MKKWLEPLPFPASGMALGFATMGNMLAGYHPGIRTVCGILAVLIMTAVTIKIALDIEGFKTALENPLILTTIPTYDMCLMVLSTYLRPFSSWAAVALWAAGLTIHFVFVGYTTYKLIFKFDINKVFASYFVTFVGMAAGSITAPVHGLESIGKILFYMGFSLYLIFLPLVIYRVAKIKTMPEVAWPNCAIICSPGSLCLAGYLSSFGAAPNPVMAGILAGFCFVLVPVGYALFFITNKRAFYPSYAAYTFPYVVSAFAMQKLLAAIETTGILSHTFLPSFLPVLVKGMIGISVASTLYVFTRYTIHIFQSLRPPVPVKEDAVA